MNRFTSILAIILLVGGVSATHAAISPEVEGQSVRLLEAGNPQAAFELLRTQEKTSAQDWFLYGMTAHKSDNLDEAERAYRTVLRLNPSSSRSKLELATVLSGKGEWSESKRLLLDVKAENPPDRVRQNIDRYLAVINEREGEYAGWRVRASAGALYDSNVNNATISDTVTMFGLPFTLSEDAKAQSDWAYTLQFEADNVTSISSILDWQTSFAVNWTDYHAMDPYDVLQLSASTGPVFKINPQTIFSLPFTADAISYTDRGDFYSTSIGVAPQLRHQLNETVALNLNGNVNWKHFIDNDDRDTLSYSVAPGIDVRSCGQGTFRFGGTVGREDSGIDVYSNHNWGLNASIFCPLGSEMAVSLYGSYGESDYDEREVAYTETRKDEKTTIGGNLQYAHQASGWDAILGLTYTHNNSNLTLYEYEKIQATASVRKKF